MQNSLTDGDAAKDTDPVVRIQLCLGHKFSAFGCSRADRKDRPLPAWSSFAFDCHVRTLRDDNGTHFTLLATYVNGETQNKSSQDRQRNGPSSPSSFPHFFGPD